MTENRFVIGENFVQGSLLEYENFWILIDTLLLTS